ncbi:MAG: hypothetical protein ACREF7_01255 [Candidatus Saccharimonadales bacterium]
MAATISLSLFIIAYLFIFMLQYFSMQKIKLPTENSWELSNATLDAIYGQLLTIIGGSEAREVENLKILHKNIKNRRSALQNGIPISTKSAIQNLSLCSERAVCHLMWSQMKQQNFEVENNTLSATDNAKVSAAYDQLKEAVAETILKNEELLADAIHSLSTPEAEAPQSLSAEINKLTTLLSENT